MVVTENFSLATPIQCRPLGGIDHLRGILVALELTAFNILDPAVAEDLSDRDALARFGVQHLQQDTAQSWWLDTPVEGLEVWVVGLCDHTLLVDMFRLPLLPAAYQIQIIGVRLRRSLATCRPAAKEEPLKIRLIITMAELHTSSALGSYFPSFLRTSGAM